MNVYDTKPTLWTDEDHRNALEADVVALGSPSAAEVWAQRCGVSAHAVCIGKTTYNRAKQLGFSSCFYNDSNDSEKSTIDNWISMIKLTALSYRRSRM